MKSVKPAIQAVVFLICSSASLAFAKHHLAMEEAAPLTAALASESRAEADRARDANRKPAEVVEFLGIGHGMSVLDLLAGGGYYTEVLSLAVGADGKVYAHNTPGALKYRDGANEKAISARLSGDRLPNVTRINTDIAAIDVAPGTLDAAITALNFHDIYNGSGKDAALGTSSKVLSLLKPGGVFGVIDHAGAADADNKAMHRINVDVVEQVLMEAGFEIEGTSDILSNPDDDRSKGVFDPSVRGHTDRFLIKARKPDSMMNHGDMKHDHE